MIVFRTKIQSKSENNTSILYGRILILPETYSSVATETSVYDANELNMKSIHAKKPQFICCKISVNCEKCEILHFCANYWKVNY